MKHQNYIKLEITSDYVIDNGKARHDGKAALGLS